GVEVRQRLLHGDDPLLLQAQRNLAGTLVKLHRTAEALPLLMNVYQHLQQLPDSDNEHARVPGELGVALFEASRFDDAEPYLREAIRLRQARHMPMNKTAGRIHLALAEICARSGRSDEATALRAAAATQ